jgi:hypothetical protein
VGQEEAFLFEKKGGSNLKEGGFKFKDNMGSYMDKCFHF